MKALKIYLCVVCVFLLVGLALGVYVWYTLQKLNGTAVPIPIGREVDTEESTGTVPSEEVPAYTIESETLSPTQQKILESFGYEGGNIHITETMILCVEKALGEGRFDEVVAGAAPTPLEAMGLIPCFKQ